MKKSAEELRQLFKNKSDCYADTWKYSSTAEQYVQGEVIQAMTEDMFVEIFMEYANQQNEFPMCTVCNEIKCECKDQQKELRCKDDIVIKKIIFPK